MKTWRDYAIRLRRREIKEYWSNKADDRKQILRISAVFLSPFFTQSRRTLKTFHLTLTSKVSLEHFAKYFSSVANDIGDTRHIRSVRGPSVAP